MSRKQRIKDYLETTNPTLSMGNHLAAIFGASLILKAPIPHKAYVEQTYTLVDHQCGLHEYSMFAHTTYTSYTYTEGT